MTEQDVLNMLSEFLEFDDETLNSYGVNDYHWIPEDYWQGFQDAIHGLEQYFKERRLS